MKSFCNPLDLSYRYSIKIAPGKQAEWTFREAADPTMLVWHDTYLLFASMSGGFWYSSDLVSWAFHATPELPIYDYAPDVRVVDGAVVFCASRRDQLCTFYRSSDPLHEPFEAVASTMEFWDPDLFQDDDGRLYLYWGCSSTEPIYGVELDRTTFAPIGEKRPLIAEHEAVYGWERKGENNHLDEPTTEMERMIRQATGTKPFIEGAYMTKRNGRYYLQYAAPGTECNVYADGVYVGTSPLGPFSYQAWNPFSSVPGGFMQGAGHGSTFQDLHGNWWHVSTMRISVNEKFERRIGLFPCHFDDEGAMWCDQRFASYPQVVPEGTRSAALAAPPWMLLTAGAAVSASSSQEGHAPELAATEDCRTWWAAERSDAHPCLTMDLGAVCEVAAVQVNLADQDLPASTQPEEAFCDAGAFFKRIIMAEDQTTAYYLEGSADGVTWQPLLDERAGTHDRPHAYVQLAEPQRLQYLRLCIDAVPMGGVAAVSGLRVFGKPTCATPLPAQVTSVAAQRIEGGLTAELSWKPAAGATTYVVRYGLEPTKLYGSWETPAPQLALTTLVAGITYWVAVDSVNAAGVTTGVPCCVLAEKRGDMHE